MKNFRLMTMALLFLTVNVFGQGSLEAVNLGLPSGTLWANMNVGASKPEGYGCYYAWGETEEKGVYNWSTYIHCDGSIETCHDLGSDIAGTKYDVAHVMWGGNWVMPTKAQQDELKNKCTYEWTMVSGVYGGKFTGPNGNSIFLPAAGGRWSGSFYNRGTVGGYWSSTQYPDGSYAAYYFGFSSGYLVWYHDDNYRYYGRSVRPVVRK